MWQAIGNRNNNNKGEDIMESKPLVNASIHITENAKLEPQGSNKPGYWKEQFNEWSKHFSRQPVHQNGHAVSKSAAE